MRKKIIDKDVLVAEIEKLQKVYSTLSTRNNYEDGLKEGRLIGYKDALSKINSLEVKEIDLEKSTNKGGITMTIEEKARAYDEALEIAKGIYKDTWNSYILKIFPELKESEDERVRKDCIKYLDWEYQHCPIDEDKMKIEKCIAWLEKQVEPKFKVGDWITNGSCIIQITSVDDRYYWHDNDCVGGDIESMDKEYHLWTIQDAKDGDVLAFNNDTIVIFKDLYNSSTFHSYCHIEDGIFDISKDEMPDWWEGKGFHPATKEQRDLLFQEICKAGYDWDEEKKELRKNEKQVEQKPKWSEEDECYMGECISAIATMDSWSFKEKLKTKDWLKSIKQRMEEQQ